MKRIAGGHTSLGAAATLLSSHADGPRAAAGDTSIAGQTTKSRRDRAESARRQPGNQPDGSDVTARTIGDSDSDDRASDTAKRSLLAEGGASAATRSMTPPGEARSREIADALRRITPEEVAAAPWLLSRTVSSACGGRALMRLGESSSERWFGMT
jgi:hypothetical protein